MRPLALSATLLLCSLFACRNPSQPAATPEDVVRNWQMLLDQNRYEEARALSAGNALAFVDYLGSFPHLDSFTLETTELLQLRCAVAGDSAVCSFFVEDEVGERIPDTLLLKKTGGRWLVYEVERFQITPLDSLRDDDEDILFLPSDSLDEELE